MEITLGHTSRWHATTKYMQRHANLKKSDYIKTKQLSLSLRYIFMKMDKRL